MKIPAALHADILRRVKKGEPWARIARLLHTSPATVTRVATRAGYAPLPASRPAGAKDLTPRTRRTTAEIERARVLARAAKREQHTAPPVRDLATGVTPWRCDCGARTTGPTCPNGHAAPWAGLLEAA